MTYLPYTILLCNNREEGLRYVIFLEPPLLPLPLSPPPPLPPPSCPGLVPSVDIQPGTLEIICRGEGREGSQFNFNLYIRRISEDNNIMVDICIIQLN